MNKKLAMKWVKALRSGKYKQGAPKKLKSTLGYCCLGVLCEIENIKSTLTPAGQYSYIYKDNYLATSAYPGKSLRHGLGMVTTEIILSDLNDEGIPEFPGERFTFEEIADIIEQEWKEL